MGAANEECPQPQTREHLMALNIIGIKNVIIVQNKIDLVDEEKAIENHKQIKELLKTTEYKDAPIIPISAQHKVNIDALIEYIVEKFEEPIREIKKEPHMYIIRSFDINKPGDSYTNLKGGVLGGSIKEGTLKIGDEIEIKPGIAMTKDGKISYKSIEAKVKGLMSDKDKLTEAIPGGSIAIMTELDPTVTKTDSLVGQIAGIKGTLPDPVTELNFDINLFDKVVTSSGELEVKPIIQTEPLMLIVNSLTTVGVVTKVNPKQATVKLKRPVMAFQDDRAVIFRRFEGNKWRICGWGSVNIN